MPCSSRCGPTGQPRDAAEARLLAHACAWADLHPAESIGDAVRFGDTPVPVAGPGAPLVAEFCVAEFAAAVGLPTETGKAYLGEALELRHRLPRTWARVGSGDLAAWRARRIARATIAPESGGGGVRGRPGGAVRAPDPAQRGGPAGGGGDRPVHARGGPAPPGGRRRTAGTSTCTPVRCPSRAPCGCRPRSTWPTPWTSTPPSRPAPPGSPTSARPRRWTCAAPKPSARWRGTAAVVGPRHRDRDHAGPGSGPGGGAACPPLRGRDHRTGRDAAPGPGGEHPLVRRRRPGPHLVRPPRHHGDGEAGGRPDRADRRSTSTRSPTGSPPRQPSGT